jgi:hypothetical protein
MTFKDLIEAFYRIRLRKAGERVLSREMRSLLNYVRELRNTQAHPAARRRETIVPRASAMLIAELANNLYGRVVADKSGLVGTQVKKDW